MSEVINFQNIVKHFGKNLVLNKIDFSVQDKDIFGLIGLSGSGKTTILNIMVGFMKANKGKISFRGKDIKKVKREIEKIFGFATQTGSFYNRLTVRENLFYFGKMYSIKKHEILQKTKELLELVELSDASNVIANQLSIGMRRRLDIACALLNDPEVLVLDEPTEDLDPTLRKEILALIKRINIEKSTTIIVTSHLLNEMETICNKIAILHHGKIMEIGTPDNLKERYSTNEEIHLKTIPGYYKEILNKLDKKNINHIVTKKDKIIIYTPNAEKVLYDLTRILRDSKEKIVYLDVNKPSLEEVFESLTRK